MPMTTRENTIESLRRLVLTTLVYGLAVVLAGLTLPSVLTPIATAAFRPAPPTVVARAPVVPPVTGPTS